MLSIPLARRARAAFASSFSSQPHHSKTSSYLQTFNHTHSAYPEPSATICQHTTTMILTSSLHTPLMSHYSAYTPPRSSPLSPLSERSTNPSPRLFDFSMSNEKKAPAVQRSFKPNPVMQTRDAATKRRRDMFFKRVQASREDKKWEARGEQVLLLLQDARLVLTQQPDSTIRLRQGA